jgi:RecB family endonuclease NucS
MREFFGITITERQKEYSFGRVDLLGINNKTNKITVIEIKHGVDNNVVNQCIKYKNGFSKDNIDVDIIIIQEDCSSIINDANKLDFKCYDYTETNNKLEFKCAN